MKLKTVFLLFLFLGPLYQTPILPHAEQRLTEIRVHEGWITNENDTVNLWWDVESDVNTSINIIIETNNDIPPEYKLEIENIVNLILFNVNEVKGENCWIVGTDDYYIIIKMDETDNGKSSFVFITIFVGKINSLGILQQDRRRKILEYIQANPGSTFSEIIREFKGGRGSIQYHLDTLVKYDYLKCQKVGKYRVYYTHSNSLTLSEVKTRLLLLNETTKRVLKILKSNPGICVSELVYESKLHRNTINKKMNDLMECGLLYKIHKGRKTHLYLQKIKNL